MKSLVQRQHLGLNLSIHFNSSVVTPGFEHGGLGPHFERPVISHKVVMVLSLVLGSQFCQTRPNRVCVGLAR